MQRFASTDDRSAEALLSLFSDMNLSASRDLATYTGYYEIKGTNGGFLTLDTTDTRLISDDHQVIYLRRIVVAYSADGKKVQCHSIKEGDSFDGGLLVVPDMNLSIQFVRSYIEGTIVQIFGKVGDTELVGSTRFNPVPLSTFVGRYKFRSGKPKEWKDKEVLTILPKDDLSLAVKFEDKGALSAVDSFTYNPAMYVMTFRQNESSECILMLGTAGANGLACSITVKNLDTDELTKAGLAETLPT